MYRIFLTAAMATAALCMSAQGTTPHVLQSVEAHNTTLQALRKVNAAEKAAARAAVALPGPEAEFAYLWGNPSNIGKRKDFSFTQPLDMGLLTGARRRMAREQGLLADSQYGVQRTSILLEAEMCYIDLVYYNAMLSMMRTRAQHASELARAMERRLDHGDVALPDYRNAQLDLQSITAEVQRYEAERQAAADRLTALNGGQPLAVNDSVYSPYALPATFGEWIARTEAASPDVRYAQSALNVSRSNVKLTRTANMPSPSVGFMGEYIAGQKQQGISVGLSIPLWSNARRMRQARAEVEAAEARHDDVRLQFRLQQQALFERQAALKRVADTYSEAVRAADTEPLLRQSLDAGNISVAEYLLSTRLYYDAATRWLDAMREWQQTCAELTAPLL